MMDVDDRPAASAPDPGRRGPQPAPRGPGFGVVDTRPKDRAEQAGYPPDYGPEQHVLTVRPSMLRARPLAFFGLALVGLAGCAAVIYGFAAAEGTQRWLWAIPGGVFLLIVAVAFFVWWLETLSASLKITNKRTIEHKGLLSRRTSEVLHDNIRNVTVSQTFWQRLWDTGEIGISSAGTEGVEIQMKSLRSPDKLLKILDLYRPLG